MLETRGNTPGKEAAKLGLSPRAFHSLLKQLKRQKVSRGQGHGGSGEQKREADGKIGHDIHFVLARASSKLNLEMTAPTPLPITLCLIFMIC